MVIRQTVPRRSEHSVLVACCYQLPTRRQLAAASRYNGSACCMSSFLLNSPLKHLFMLHCNSYIESLFDITVSSAYVLQVATNLSPTNPYTTIVPLTVVLIITMIKQGIEDFKRHRADTTMNNRRATVIRNGSEVQLPWKDVLTGDLLLVHDKEELPADIVILTSSEESAKCFIEVSTLSCVQPKPCF